MVGEKWLNTICLRKDPSKLKQSLSMMKLNQFVVKSLKSKSQNN